MKRPKRTATVKITEGDYSGLEMTLSLSVPLGLFVDFLHARGDDDATLTQQTEGFEWFANEVLLAWNLTEDDDKTPVPAGWEGFQTIEPALVLTIANKWRDAVTDTGAPLGRPSSGSIVSAPSTTTPPASASRSRARSSRRR